jgi:hypothetical protein
MKKCLGSLAILLMGILIVAMPLNPVYDQTRPDPKVWKDCEAVNHTYDSSTYYLYLKAPHLTMVVRLV